MEVEAKAEVKVRDKVETDVDDDKTEVAVDIEIDVPAVSTLTATLPSPPMVGPKCRRVDARSNSLGRKHRSIWGSRHLMGTSVCFPGSSTVATGGHWLPGGWLVL